MRHAENDEERCISPSGRGPCPFAKAAGTDYCERHGAGCAAAMAAKRRANKYKIEFAKRRYEDFMSDDKYLDLQDEIALMRVTLEQVLKKCDSGNAFYRTADRIARLASQIQGLVVACDKLKSKSHTTMSKTEALNFASEIGNIIAEYIEDEKVMDVIIERMVGLIGDTNEPKHE